MVIAEPGSEGALFVLLDGDGGAEAVLLPPGVPFVTVVIVVDDSRVFCGVSAGAANPMMKYSIAATTIKIAVTVPITFHRTLGVFISFNHTKIGFKRLQNGNIKRQLTI